MNDSMTAAQLQAWLKATYPTENERHEWKAWHSLKSCISGRRGEDLVSYVSALANMDGGTVVMMGVQDGTLAVTGIQDFADYTLENVKQIRTWGPLIAKRDKATGRVIKLVEVQRGKKTKIEQHIANPGERVPRQQQYLVPDPKRAGHTWRRFLASIERMARSDAATRSSVRRTGP